MVKGPPRNEKLERLLSRKADLGNLRYRLWRDEEEDPEQGEALDRFLSELLSVDEEVKSASKDIWHITKLDREETIRSLRQLRDDLSEMALNEFNERWMTRTASTVDYWLEVAVDLEGVLYSFAHPVFDAEGPILGSLLRPGLVVLVRSFISLLYLAAGVIALYVAFGTSFRWVGWLLAAYFGWLIYHRAAKTDRLEEDVNRWRRNLTAIDGCVQELLSGHFDASEIARRLREEENSGLFVRTTIFTILQRSAALHGAKDVSETSAAGHRKPTQEEMEQWAFQRGSDLTLTELRAMKADEIVHLIEKSYFYPSEKAYIERFEYKHDQVDEGSSSKFGYEVHGFRRLSGTQDWEPYRFLASDKESQTSSCAGTIKRLN